LFFFLVKIPPFSPPPPSFNIVCTYFFHARKDYFTILSDATCIKCRTHYRWSGRCDNFSIFFPLGGWHLKYCSLSHQTAKLRSFHMQQTYSASFLYSLGSWVKLMPKAPKIRNNLCITLKIM